MYSAAKVEGSDPTVRQAIKILKNLTKKYASFFDAEQRFYLDDYASELRAPAHDLKETAQILGRLLTIAIEDEISLTIDEIEELQAIRDENLSNISKLWRRTTALPPTMVIVDEDTASILYYDESQIEKEALKLHQARSDERSLKRAVQTLAPQTEAEIDLDGDWAYEMIMQCHP